jgi:hypothetical protein
MNLEVATSWRRKPAALAAEIGGNFGGNFEEREPQLVLHFYAQRL